MAAHSLISVPARRFSVDPSCVDNANKAQVRIAEMIAKGASRAGNVIERIQTEVPTDVVTPASRMHFDYTNNRRMIVAGFVDEAQGLHSHALGQAGALAGMPWVRDLVDRVEDVDAGGPDPWGARLAAHSLNEAFSRMGSRQLVRSVGRQVRGIVSDRYRRIDARPIVDSALAAFQKVGLQPYDGRWLETKLEIQAIIPTLYSPVPGELVAFGLSLRTSDYGDGAFDVRAFMLRPACANGAITDSVLRKVHVGTRLSEDLQLSQRTYDYDTKTMASLTRDVVEGAFAGDAIEKRLLGMKIAFEREVDPVKAQASLRKHLTKAEAQKATDLFSSPDVVTLPPGNNALRMSNAISWLANVASQNGNERRAVELQEAAGAWV